MQREIRASVFSTAWTSSRGERPNSSVPRPGGACARATPGPRSSTKAARFRSFIASPPAHLSRVSMRASLAPAPRERSLRPDDLPGLDVDENVGLFPGGCHDLDGIDNPTELAFDIDRGHF